MAYASYIIDASKKSKYTMFVKEITVMNFENCFPLWNDLNTTQKKKILRQFNHTACKKRDNHSQWKPGLHWIITG